MGSKLKNSRLGVKNASLLGAAALAASVSTGSFAEPTKSNLINVTAGVDSMNIGGEFRSEFNYNDQKLAKPKDGKVDATQSLNIDTAKIKIWGDLNSSTEYKFRFNLYGPKSATDTTYTPFDYGYGLHKFGKTFSLALGKQKVLQGGWDKLGDSFRDHVAGIYAQNLAFGSYEPMLAFNLNVAGTVTLQVLNDKVADKTNPKNTLWNTTKHPTYIIGWLGDLGVVKPLLAVGTWDNQHSKWLDVGIKAETHGVFATLDVKYDTIGRKGMDADGKAKDFTDTALSYTFKGSYAVKQVATPFIYFSKYNKKQFEDTALGQKDIKTNTLDPATQTIKFDDNGTSWGLGADFTGFGKGWYPYLAVVGTSGDVPDATDATKTESRSGLQVRIGAYAEI